MEHCILAFKGRNVADRALKDAIEQHGTTDPWLHDVGTVPRPRRLEPQPPPPHERR
jgi:hypothetical protein